jgi:RND family efflux transporter MFP subunit
MQPIRHVRAAAAGLASLTLVLAGCNDRSQTSEQKTAPSSAGRAAFTVKETTKDDLKAVLATVRSKKVVDARVRTPGTVAKLSVVEGAHVDAGQVLGLVADPKIALRIRASDAQIVALESRLATAKAELERATELQKRGVSPQARLDQARTAFDVATNELAAAKSERAVIERQVEEGQVLAPAGGRILRVPVTEGSVVMPGESIATIAANEYLLRLEVPERHARFMREGDVLKVGKRGLSPDQPAVGDGRVVQVYPEIQSGRVIADAEAAGLGDYFVGERVLAWISAGERRTVAIPRELTFNRHGLDYVRLAREGGDVDVVVQLALAPAGAATAGSSEVEVLTGLKPDDRLVKP